MLTQANLMCEIAGRVLVVVLIAAAAAVVAAAVVAASVAWGRPAPCRRSRPGSAGTWKHLDRPF